MQKLGVLFGGICTEHEVSVITALQLIEHTDKSKYQVIPIYVDKAGKWWTGKKLLEKDYFKIQDLFNPKGLETFSTDISEINLDVAILCFHGEYGEGGNVQGLLELAGIPYQGPELLPSALAMDKISFRQVLQAENIPQTEFMHFSQTDWQSDKKAILNKIKERFSLPIFLKPSRSGSSIGVVRVAEEKNLEKKIIETLKFDTRVHKKVSSHHARKIKELE